MISACSNYEVYLDDAAVAALKDDDIGVVPKTFSIVTTTVTDPVTDNDLTVWEDDLLVQGMPATFALGFATTRETKRIHGGIPWAARNGLKICAWQTMEYCRLGCYRWREKNKDRNKQYDY